MFYNSDVVVTNGSILFSKFDGIVKYLFSYRWVKIFDVKLDECLKNIPVPTLSSYKLRLILRT